MKEYKSSPSRLTRLLAKRVETWKVKAAEKQKTIKRLMGNVDKKSESRDYWKNKAKKAEKALRELEKKHSREQKNRESSPGGKTETFQGLPLAQDVKGDILVPPKGHTYPLYTIFLGVQSTVDALVSMRGSSRFFQLFSTLFTMPAPSFSSVRMWVYRVGLHAFQREFEYRTDWILALDMTNELGQPKCLVIVGIPQARLLEFEQQSQEGERNGLVLNHKDVAVLDMHVANHFTGEIVEQRLEILSQRIGEPVQIISDHGSDVKKGIEIFVENHEGIVYSYDITHQIALFLKGALADDEGYQSFCQQSIHTAQKIQQTELYFLIPPAQRTKGRYLNVDRYVQWAEKVSNYGTRGDFSAIGTTFELDNQAMIELINVLDFGMFVQLFRIEWPEYRSEESFVSAIIQQIGQDGFEEKGAEILNAADIGRRRFEEKLGWITEFKEDISTYSQMVEIGKTAQEQVKTQGLHEGSARDFQERVEDMEVIPRVQQFKNQIVNYLLTEGGKIPQGQILLGTTDVLESIFGKYKLFSHGPFKEIGKMLLTIPLFTANIASDFVKEAMEKVRAVDVEVWARRTLGQSSLSKRRLAFDPQEKA